MTRGKYLIANTSLTGTALEQPTNRGIYPDTFYSDIWLHFKGRVAGAAMAGVTGDGGLNVRTGQHNKSQESARNIASQFPELVSLAACLRI
jgi:hypothetical protein